VGDALAKGLQLIISVPAIPDPIAQLGVGHALAGGAVHFPVVAVGLLHLGPAQPSLLVRSIHTVPPAIADRCAGYACSVAAAESISRTPDLLTHGGSLIGGVQAVGGAVTKLVQSDAVAPSAPMTAARGVRRSRANGERQGEENYELQGSILMRFEHSEWVPINRLPLPCRG